MIAIDEHNHGDGVGTVDLDCGQILFYSTIEGRLAFSIGSVNLNNPSGLNGIEIVGSTSRNINYYNNEDTSGIRVSSKG